MTKNKQFISWAQVDLAVRDLAERLGRIVDQYKAQGKPVDIGPPVDEDPAHAIVAGMLAHRMGLPYDGAGGATIVVCAEPTWRDGLPIVGGRVSCWTYETAMDGEQYERGVAVALFWTIEHKPGMAVYHALAPDTKIVWPWESSQ